MSLNGILDLLEYHPEFSSAVKLAGKRRRGLLHSPAGRSTGIHSIAGSSPKGAAAGHHAAPGRTPAACTIIY